MLSNEIFENVLFSYGYGSGHLVDNKYRNFFNNIPGAIGRGVVNAGKWLYNTIDKGVDWVWDKAKNAWGNSTAAQQAQRGIDAVHGISRDSQGNASSPSYKYNQTSTPS